MYLSFVDYYHNQKFFNKLAYAHKSNPEFFTINFDFDYIHSNFPFSFWNGDVNTCIDTDILTRPDFENIRNNILVPLCFDFSNIYLKENDLYDRHIKAILETFANQGNYIRLSNPALIEVFKKLYEGYFFVLSNIVGLDINEFKFIEIQSNHPILDKKKAIITIGSKCSITCPFETYLNCLQSEQYYQYNFYENSTFQNCQQKEYNYKNLQQDIDNYRQEGYNHFKIMITNPDILLKIFIKPEHQLSFLELLKE